MKKINFFIVFCIFMFGLTQAQLINVNPDPNGEPWIAGGVKMPSPAEMKIIEQIPELVLPVDFTNRLLPFSIDNSLNQYFRPVFNQVGGSCAQASGVGYNFTYEMNFRRSLPSNVTQNQYPSHFTYNFLNGGSMSNGSNCWDGWNIIKYAGCPSVADYGGMSPPNNINWMSGYTKYYNGMHNKTIDYFMIKVNTPEGLQTLRNYFYDHGEAAAVGGLVNFYAGASGYTMVNLPAGTPQGGMKVITKWGTDVNHAMTFAGFDDSIRYDFNNDGIYTNHIDINSDGKVDMKDWEIGGVIVVNSWGTSWGNSGKCYMMYKLLAEAVSNGGIFNSEVFSIKVKPVYEPILTYKITLKHNSRNMIRITAGSSPDVNASSPSYTLNFPLFNYQGGNFYMQGGSTIADQTIEIGLDVTPLLSFLQSSHAAKFFLMVDESDPSGTGQGEIISFSAISYSNGIEETFCTETNVPLVNNGKTTLSIVKTVVFDQANITTSVLPDATFNQPYSHQLNAAGGVPPYKWNLKINYTEQSLQATYPTITSQQLTPSDLDDGFAKVKLDFPFMFYGSYYDSVYVTTDGSIIFDDEFNYIRTDASLIASKSITVYGSDLQIYPEQGDGMWYEGDATHATFRWKTSGFGAPTVNVEMALTIYANGEIHFFYGNGITPGIEWTAGVSKGDGINYTIASISNAPVVPNDTKFKYTGTDFPIGMQLDDNGLFHGIPMVNNKTWNIEFMVTDMNNIANSKIIPFTVVPTGINEMNSNDGLTVSCSPNPFLSNLTFVISDQENKIKQVSINIYDTKGELIYTVCNGLPFAGIKEILWNAPGKEMKDGIYFVMFKIGDTVIYRKIIKTR